MTGITILSFYPSVHTLHLHLSSLTSGRLSRSSWSPQVCPKPQLPEASWLSSRAFGRLPRLRSSKSWRVPARHPCNVAPSPSALSIYSLMIYIRLDLKDAKLTVSLPDSDLRWWTPWHPLRLPPRWMPCLSSSTSPTLKAWFCRRGSSTLAASLRIPTRRCWRRCWWVSIEAGEISVKILKVKRVKRVQCLELILQNKPI